ncbi:MAG: hypothetical protein LBK82_07975, partial [Planctomycetaceae bacterium]|nr:hypothetical protein [Planctomycetaceae bacterium]
DVNSIAEYSGRANRLESITAQSVRPLSERIAHLIIRIDQLSIRKEVGNLLKEVSNPLKEVGNPPAGRLRRLSFN